MIEPTPFPQRTTRRYTEDWPITPGIVIRAFHHVFEESGIPRRLWDKHEMVILSELARRLRRYCEREWNVWPAIVEGDTLPEAAGKVIRCLESQKGAK